MRGWGGGGKLLIWAGRNVCTYVDKSDLNIEFFNEHETSFSLKNGKEIILGQLHVNDQDWPEKKYFWSICFPD